MFAKLARFRPATNRVAMLAPQRPLHSNDNLRAAFRLAGESRPILACEWFLADTGQLGCRWQVELRAGDPEPSERTAEFGSKARFMAHSVPAGTKVRSSP